MKATLTNNIGYIEISAKLGEIKLNSKQMKVYEGLSNIGEEIASCYIDGLRVLDDERIKTKANLLAHIAREIDGGVRDILSTDKDKKKRQEELKNFDLGDYKNNKGHIASIHCKGRRNIVGKHHM